MLLTTRRLTLRPVTPDDADLLVELDADPAVMRFVTGGAPTSADRVTAWVIPRMQLQYQQYGAGMWIAFTRTPEPDFAGWVQLRRPRHSALDELELSYRFRRAMWGRGLATEAATAVIGALFADYPVERIFASTHVAHAASRQVLTRLGMRLAADADARILTDPDVDVEYEILRANWLAGRGRHAAGRTRTTAVRTGWMTA